MTDEPAFRKWTPSVARGIRYAIAALEFDARHGTVEPGLPEAEAEHLRNAATWLRDQFRKHEGKTTP